MPLLPKRPHWGVDGATYAAGDGETACTFQWWATPPDEWQPLGDIVDELQRLAHPTELSPGTDDER